MQQSLSPLAALLSMIENFGSVSTGECRSAAGTAGCAIGKPLVTACEDLQIPLGH